MTSLHDRARDWLAEHLLALVSIMLALWAPSILFTVLVDVKLVGGAGSGYPSLGEPGLLLGIAQLALMAAALLSLRLQHRVQAWQLICGSLGIWAAQATWTIQGRLRLVGPRDLASRETLLTLVTLAIASLVLFEVRDRYTGDAGDAATARPTTSQPPVVLQPDTR